MRLFVAVTLPEPVRAALAGEIDRLRPLAGGVAWVAPANLHVTLEFLGEVADERRSSLAAALAGAAAGSRAFDLAVVGLGAFPSTTRPRVVWAGLGAGRDRLGALAAQVEDALAALGFEREWRAFSAHITLGRVREPRSHPDLAAALEAGRGREYGAVGVDHIALVRSELSPRGARYTVLEAPPLAPR